MNEIKNNLASKKHPIIEHGKLMESFLGEYSLRNQVFFAREDRDYIPDAPVFGPRFASIQELIRSEVKIIGPEIDVTGQTLKINFEPIHKLEKIYLPLNTDFFKSFLIHISVLCCYLILNYISLIKQQEPQVVEVSFGLTDSLAQTLLDNSTPMSEGQTEATKTKEDLTQLTKNSAPDIAPKSSVENEPQKANKENDLIFKEEKKIEVTSKKEEKNSVAKNSGPKLNPTQNKITEKDFLKRKEEDLRKIAEEKKQGVHGKLPHVPDGKKHVSNSLPKSPFQSADELPDTPPGIAPTGDEKGVNVAGFDAYRLYLKNQLRLNWNVSEGAAYPKNLTIVVKFTVNQFGYLINKPSIVKPSGNREFDDLAIKATHATFPVSNPPPKSIHPPQTFQAKFSAKGVE